MIPAESKEELHDKQSQTAPESVSNDKHSLAEVAGNDGGVKCTSSVKTTKSSFRFRKNACAAYRKHADY
jgi:hypothetical protein